MKDLAIGTKVRIKSEEELKELFDREYNRLNDEWNKETESGTIVFIDGMLAYCDREYTISSEFTGRGYYMKEIGCYWNPDWFDVVKDPTIEVGDIITLKTMADAAKDEETLKNYRYTFGDITYKDMWAKDYEVKVVEAGTVAIQKCANDTHIWVPVAWIHRIKSKEETYRRKIEEYVAGHDFNENLPDELAPYDWTIQIDKEHRFIKAYVVVDGFRFEVFEGLDGKFKVEK